MPENASDPQPPPADAPPAPPAPKRPTAPVTRPPRGFSPVWVIPIIAALLGLYLVFKHYSEEGPKVTVRFDTAEGIMAGKTPVLCRSVNIGTVGTVVLAKDRKSVLATLDMTREADELLEQDTQIWVVRPRYGGGGISGLGTIVSGSYLELQPGISHTARRTFVGLENPPVTPPGVPGLHFTLISETAGGLNPGSSIIYKGVSVGSIETRVFHPETGQMEFGAFIDSEYENLVTKDTRFWNASGIDLQVGADGFKLHTGTLESIVSGGVTFSPPENPRAPHAQPPNGSVFKLYDSFTDANRTTLNPIVPYLLLFTESVRGLAVDAPVEFRGVRLGTVMGVSFNYLPNDSQHRVPVLIKIDPSLLIALPSENYSEAEEFMSSNVKNGLRASLKTGNLLTGQLYVDLDFSKDAPPGEIANIEGYQVIPTIAGGLGELQEKLSALLDKFQALPIDKTVGNLNDALASVRTTLGNLDTLLGSKQTQELPADLRDSLAELQKTLSGYNNKSDFYQNLSGTLHQLDDTLRSLRGVTDTLERKPNSIIFGKGGSVEPPKGSGH